MKHSETVNLNPVTGAWEHVVNVSFDDVALDNAMRRNSGDTGFTLKAEAKEKYEIPVELLYLDCVRDYVSSGGKDKFAEAKMLKTVLPNGVEVKNIITSTASGQSKQRIFLGGDINAS